MPSGRAKVFSGKPWQHAVCRLQSGAKPFTLIAVMWFKQLTLYRLDPSKLPDLNDLEAALQQRPFVPCSGLDWFSQGFAPAARHQPDLMLFRQGPMALVALRRQDKVLPTSVIRDFTEDKVQEIEARELRKVGKKEKQQLREQVADDLLPRAFSRSSHTRAWLDLAQGWLAVDAGSASKAEALLGALRDALPPFPARLPRTQLAPATQMTSWLLGSAPEGFALDADCELKAPGEDGAVIRCTRQDLTASEIRAHLETGKQVTKLGLIWQERIRFVLTEDLTVRRLQFLDVLQEEAEQAGDDAESLFEATFALMTGELALLTAALIEALGGEPADS